jgi:hypothetical protein
MGKEIPPYPHLRAFFEAFREVNETQITALTGQLAALTDRFAGRTEVRAELEAMTAHLTSAWATFITLRDKLNAVLEREALTAEDALELWEILAQADQRPRDLPWFIKEFFYAEKKPE